MVQVPLLSEGVTLLRCPLCAGDLHVVQRALACPAGHSFDVARQGYVNLLGGRRPATGGDDVAMLSARERAFAAGLFDPVIDTVASRAGGVDLRGAVVDVGCGPGAYLAASLRARPGSIGLGCDVSVVAARRAARAHPRAAAVVADIWAGLPVRDGAAAVLLDVFAPRNGDDFARLVHPAGRLIVVTPERDHLASIVADIGRVGVDDDKSERLERALGPRFRLDDREHVRWPLDLSPDQALDLVGMGPSARHRSEAQLRAGAAARPRWQTEGSVVVSVFARR